jgi:hypothetical protein
MKQFAFSLAEKPLPPPTMDDGHEALVRVRPDLERVDTSGATVCMDVPLACAVALGARPAIQQLRPRILDELPRVPIEEIDALEDRALALYYAHALCTPRSRRNDEARETYNEAKAIRAELLEAAGLLSRKGLLDPTRLAAIPRGRAAFDLAEALTGLSLLYRQHWSVVSHKTAISRDDCERADVVGRRLLRILGDRVQSPVEGFSLDQARDQRLRCFVLLRRSYAWCRRAAEFLRFEEGDAQEYVPPLHRKGGRHRKARGEAVEGGIATKLKAAEPAPA